MTTAEPDSSNANFDLSLASGQERAGWLGFEVPESAQNLRLIYAPEQLSNKAIHIELW